MDRLEQKYPIFYAIVIVAVALFFVTLLDKSNSAPNRIKYDSGIFYSNEEFIDGLYNNLDLTDDKEVFAFVFNSLSDEITVYPTENYYYFKFTANGKTVWGSLTLYADERDKGVLGFGYSIRNTDDSDYNEGGGGSYSQKDGVSVTKIDPLKYSATYGNKTVIFNLSAPDLKMPAKAKLLPSEKYIGPVFDESGLQFHLIFSDKTKKFMYFLNEDEFVPETFDDLGMNILRGKRTGFAFYEDRDNSRKILIGVEGRHVQENDWYDGPFDQLPDNYIYTDQIEIQRYIEQAYPNVVGRIDKYGNYLDRPGTRVAIAPYTVYFSHNQLWNLMSSCAANYLKGPEFYACITQQVYNTPL